MEISIVVQGAISSITNVCLNSLRDAFPCAEIILSTWAGSDVSYLKYDKLVLSKDPGSVFCDEVSNIQNNVNRQLVSTKAGISVATGEYIIKTRTDIIFNDNTLLNYFSKYDDIDSPYFEQRLLICNWYTRNPRTFKTCFHPSDWIVFGKANDVRKYYQGTPLMTEDEANWFRNHIKSSTFLTNYICRYTPEQHIFLGFLQQCEEIELDSYYDISPALIVKTEQTFAECFVVLDYKKQMNITFSKYNPNRYFEKNTLISHWQWRALYEHYCQKKKSWRWGLYCLQMQLMKMIPFFRGKMIKVLDYFGLKEFIKACLRKVRI